MSKHRFVLSGEVTISVTTVVWADSPAAAKRKVANRGNTSGLVDAGDEREEWITSGELDGTVKIIGCEQDDTGEEEED